MRTTQYQWQATKKTFLLSGLSLLMIHYGLSYIEESFPTGNSHFKDISTRSVSIVTTNTNNINNATATSLVTSSDTTTASRIKWVPSWQRKGETYARSFYKEKSHNNNNNNPKYWWCTQDSYEKSCGDGGGHRRRRRSRRFNDNDVAVDDDSPPHKLCNPKGLIYVKVPKSGSTTISKIVKRIVDKVAQRSNLLPSSTKKCQHREDHISGAGLWYGNRDVDQSFLFASIRDPADRAMSRFFWSYVTRHQQQEHKQQPTTNNNNDDDDAEDEDEDNSSSSSSRTISSSSSSTPTDDFIRDYLNKSTTVATGCTSKGQGGYQLNYITMQTIPEYSAWNPNTPSRIINPNRVEQLVQQVMLDYDFIILNERMEESLVVLQFLLGLQTGDIVSLSYNVGGSYRYEHGKCKQLMKSHTSDGMKEYFESEEWRAKNYGDYLLFAAVNRSIDLTIDRIGRSEFESALGEFRRLEAKVNKICSEKVPFPCSANGTVLFHSPNQPIPHNKIASCIDEVVMQDDVELQENWHR